MCLRRGFTLVELLVVIAIIGILLTLLLPAVQATREAARRISCSNNMKQIGLAIQNHVGARKMFPPGSTSDVEQGGWINNPQKKNIHSWRVLILPFMELGSVHDQIDFTVSSLDPANLPVASQLVPEYRCPSYRGPDYSADPNYTKFSAEYAIANYVAMGSSDVGHLYGQNTGLFDPDGTIYPLSKTRPKDISDGLSRTIIVAETRERGVTVWVDGGTSAIVAKRYDKGNPPTYAGSENPLNYAPYFIYSKITMEYGSSSEHPSGVTHLLGDGSVQFIADDITADVYAAMTTRAGAD